MLVSVLGHHEEQRPNIGPSRSLIWLPRLRGLERVLGEVSDGLLLAPARRGLPRRLEGLVHAHCRAGHGRCTSDLEARWRWR